MRLNLLPKKISRFSFFCILTILSCGSTNKDKKAGLDSIFNPNPEFKKYWNQGKAEITSYALQQSRYGEIREGEAVTVFVTEPFSKSSNTKADSPNASSVEVLKCNFTKNFNTGIYPYSIMTSTFVPIDSINDGIKVSCSVQEWCGHVYSELKRTNRLAISTLSYFEGENRETTLQNGLIEDDVWTKLRISPNNIPTGEHMVLPALHLIRLLHLPMEPQKCIIELTNSSNLSRLKLFYPTLSRTLEITFKSKFPYEIIEWTDAYPDGFGPNKQFQISSGKMKKRVMLPYWQLNKNIDARLRDSLQLKF